MRVPLKILFVMRHAGYVRNFEPALRLLAERGHRIHLALELSPRRWMRDQTAALERLSAAFPNFSYGPTPVRDTGGWGTLAKKLRLSIDYLRYLEPRYRDAPRLRERAELRAPRAVRRLATGAFRGPHGLKLLGGVLRAMERAVPNSPGIDAFICEHRPDLVLVTPLVELGSPQADYLRCAKARGIRTGLCVSSWDNLTNKGLIQQVPDIVTVWNDAQKQEAIELHGVPAGRVVVTGAQAYDHWFAWAPSTSREDFCRRVGLRADRPFLLYLCSSPFIAPGSSEATFVEGWARRLSQGDSRLREVGILIRPHPQNAQQWQDVDLSPLGEVAVWPRAGADPVDAQSKADFYDSMYHCAAVVGVNTSALIESAIVGRPVYTLLAPEFQGTQEGTLHFHHLLHVNGGLLHVADSFGEHAAQLAEALAAEDGRHAERNRRFLEAFVRPHGLDEPAAPKLVAAIEGAGARPALRPQQRPVWADAVRVALAPLAGYAGWRARGRKRLHAFRQAGRKRWYALRQAPGRKRLLRMVLRAGIRTSLSAPPVRRIAGRYGLPALKLLTSQLAEELAEASANGALGASELEPSRINRPAIGQDAEQEEDEVVARLPASSSG